MGVSLWKEGIETRLRELFQPFEPEILYRAMGYYLFQAGKRIRPLLVCGVCHALGGDLEDAITVGCVVELVHNYSLIHDDLPALDNDSVRRGKPTCHIVFGEDLAILAGDALLTYAFEILSRPENFRSLREKELLFLVRELAFCAGPSGMVGGQVLDIRRLTDREEISIKKTAKLFVFCFVAGGLIAKRKDILKNLEELGSDFGLLFQMVDDYKDRDGFYNLYGEELWEKIKDLRENLVINMKKVGLFSKELEEIINIIVSS